MNKAASPTRIPQWFFRRVFRRVCPLVTQSENCFAISVCREEFIWKLRISVEMPTLKPGIAGDDHSDASVLHKPSSQAESEEKVDSGEASPVPKERGDSTTETKPSESLSSDVFNVDPELSDTSVHSIGNGKDSYDENADKKETISEKSDRFSPTSSYTDLGSLDTLPLQSSEWASINSVGEIQNNIYSLDSNFTVSTDAASEINGKAVEPTDMEVDQLLDSLNVNSGSTKSLAFESSMGMTPEPPSIEFDKTEQFTDITTDTNYVEVTDITSGTNYAEEFTVDKKITSDETGISTADSEWMDILGSGDLLKRTVVIGEGKETRPDRGQMVTVNITGRLEDGRIVECCERLKFTVGDAEVIQGLDLALPLMEKGEFAELIVKPRFAYDSLGKLPEIPPNTTITYSVKLLDIENVPELEHMTLEERMKIGNQKREHGNFWYGRGDYSQAVLCYRRSIDFLDDENQNFTEPPEELQELLEAKMKVYNNIAAAQLKLEAYDAALKSIDTVLKVQPDNVKALFRKGKILAAQGNLNDAIGCMKKALHLEPDTKIIHQELTKLRKKKKTQNKLEKDMYRRMLGQKLNEERNNNKSKSSLTMWGTILGGIAAVVVGIFVYRQYHGGW